jgi:hypothetical protein
MTYIEPTKNKQEVSASATPPDQAFVALSISLPIDWKITLAEEPQPMELELQ